MSARKTKNASAGRFGYNQKVLHTHAQQEVVLWTTKIKITKEPKKAVFWISGSELTSTRLDSASRRTIAAATIIGGGREW